MYLLEVIPINRNVPGGTLTYLSAKDVAVGSIITVQLKNKEEIGLVTKNSDVKNEKSYIRTLPYKLITIGESKNKNETKILPVEIMKAFAGASVYTLAPIQNIIRATLGKGHLHIFDFLNIYTKINKKEDSDSNKLPQEIVVNEPQRLSLYGELHLGFDPIILLIFICRNLNIKIILSSHELHLRYQEFINKDFVFVSKNPEQENKTVKPMKIILRDEEDYVDKKNSLSKELQKDILKAIEKNLKVLIITATKGYASTTSCNDCKVVHSCLKCTTPLKLVKNSAINARKYGIHGDYIFVCNVCKTGSTALVKCTNCDSWNLTPLGYGFEKITEEVTNLIKNSCKGSTFTEKMKNIKIGDKNTLMSTLQKIKINDDTNGDTKNKLDLIIIPSLGPLFYSQSFDGIEKVFDTIAFKDSCSIGAIVQVAHENERELLEMNKKDWAKGEMANRKMLHYPPFARRVTIKVNTPAGQSKKIVEAVTKILANDAVPNTLSISENYIGTKIIECAFPTTHWSLTSNNYSLPSSLSTLLAPFQNYISVFVY